MLDLRLFVTDVDRTLLTHDHALPLRVVAAISAMQDAGIRVILASARSPAGLRPFAERLRASDLAVCFNGAWAGNVSTGMPLFRETVGRATALKVMAAAQAAGANPMWFSSAGIHVLDDNEAAFREARVTAEPMAVTSHIDGLPDEPGKIMCVASDPSDRRAFDLLREQFGGRLSVSASHPRLLEIGPPGVSKRTALEALAGCLGVTSKQCAAAGDAENDLGMLGWAGAAVSVRNALPEVRELAGFVGPSCDQGGLADGIAWLMDRCRTPVAAF
jgi:Cof subfamily protein (haloacid dehalogenase superfamily)